MADFTTQVGFELAKKAAPLLACSDARDHLNHAFLVQEETLKVVEKHLDLLEHDFVHQWRIIHTTQVANWTNLVAELNRFDSLSVVQKLFNIRLRREITSSALDHSKSCQDSWVKVQAATSEIRSQIASHCARENGMSRNGREYGTIIMDIGTIPVQDTPTPSSTPDAFSRLPGGTIPKNRIASRQTLSAPPEVTP